jgi:protein-tyrosine-phosphatase
MSPEMSEPAADPAGGRVSRHSSDEVLVVCRANLCRSPAAELLLGRAFGGLGLAWTVSSAGTAATRGTHGICPLTAGALASTELGVADFDLQHHPRPVTAAILDTSGLVLTASQEERSVLARLAPATRARTFTLVEAALLASYAAQAAPEARISDLPSLARLMHQHRGRVVATTTRSRRRRRDDVAFDSTDSLDVADAHASDGPTHDHVLARIRWAVDHLATGLTALTTSPETDTDTSPETSNGTDRS